MTGSRRPLPAKEALAALQDLYTETVKRLEDLDERVGRLEKRMNIAAEMVQGLVDRDVPPKKDYRRGPQHRRKR